MIAKGYGIMSSPLGRACVNVSPYLFTLSVCPPLTPSRYSDITAFEHQIFASTIYKTEYQLKDKLISMRAPYVRGNYPTATRADAGTAAPQVLA